MHIGFEVRDFEQRRFKNPLLRGGAEERVVAGVCFCYKLINAETHPYTPLKRGIAQSRAFFLKQLIEQGFQKSPLERGRGRTSGGRGVFLH
jgi:hypothetical protein